MSYEVRCTVHGRTDSIRDSGTDSYDTVAAAAERAHEMNQLTIEDGGDIVYFVDEVDA